MNITPIICLLSFVCFFLFCVSHVHYVLVIAIKTTVCDFCFTFVCTALLVYEDHQRLSARDRGVPRLCLQTRARQCLDLALDTGEAVSGSNPRHCVSGSVWVFCELCVGRWRRCTRRCGGHDVPTGLSATLRRDTPGPPHGAGSRRWRRQVRGSGQPPQSG